MDGWISIARACVYYLYLSSSSHTVVILILIISFPIRVIRFRFHFHACISRTRMTTPSSFGVCLFVCLSSRSHRIVVVYTYLTVYESTWSFILVIITEEDALDKKKFHSASKKKKKNKQKGVRSFDATRSFVRSFVQKFLHARVLIIIGLLNNIII